jgi:hypothetical protein
MIMPAPTRSPQATVRYGVNSTGQPWGGYGRPSAFEAEGRVEMRETVFLHQPVQSIEDVQGFLANKEEESEVLDFKAVPWKKAKPEDEADKKTKTEKKDADLETAKDVAAMANQRGGDIIVGVGDVNDRANGWNAIPEKEIKGAEDEVRQALVNHLRPAELGEAVDIFRLRIPEKNGYVMVVSVPASAELAAVEETISDKKTFNYPVRVGKRTTWLGHSEVIMRLSATARAIYLRLLAAKDELKDVYVRFSSPLGAISGGVFLPIFLPQGKDHGQLLELASESLRLKMGGFKTESGFKPPGATPIEVPGILVPKDAIATIPLHLIDTSWVQHGLGAHVAVVCIALDGHLIWNGGSWTVRTGSW